MFSTHVIQTIDEFKTISETWQGLLQDAQENNIALDHAWLLTWLTHFLPEQIFVVLVYDDQKNWLPGPPFKFSEPLQVWLVVCSAAYNLSGPIQAYMMTSKSFVRER